MVLFSVYLSGSLNDVFTHLLKKRAGQRDRAFSVALAAFQGSRPDRIYPLRIERREGGGNHTVGKLARTGKLDCAFQLGIRKLREYLARQIKQPV